MPVNACSHSEGGAGPSETEIPSPEARADSGRLRAGQTAVYAIKVLGQVRYGGAAARPVLQTQKNFHKAKLGTSGFLFDVLREAVVKEVPYKVSVLELVPVETPREALPRVEFWKRELHWVEFTEATANPYFFVPDMRTRFFASPSRPETSHYHRTLMRDMKLFFPKALHEIQPRRTTPGQTKPNPLNSSLLRTNPKQGT